MLSPPPPPSADQGNPGEVLAAWEKTCSKLDGWRDDLVLQVAPGSYSVNWISPRPLPRKVSLSVWMILPEDELGCGLARKNMKCFSFCEKSRQRNVLSRSVKEFFESASRGSISIEVASVRDVTLPNSVLDGDREVMFKLGAEVAKKSSSLVSSDVVIYILPINYWRNSMFPHEEKRRGLYSSPRGAFARGREIWMVGCDFSMATHEIGHYLGLQHSGSRMKTPNLLGFKSFQEYYDVSTMMSGGYALKGNIGGQKDTKYRGLSAFHVYKLGGIGDSQIMTVTEGSKSFVLEPLSRNKAEGYSAARIVTPAPPGSFNETRVVLWLETREKVAHDRSLDKPLCTSLWQQSLVKTLIIRQILANGVSDLIAIVPRGKSIVINGVLLRFGRDRTVEVDFAGCKTRSCVQRKAEKVLRKLRREGRSRKCSSSKCQRRIARRVRQVNRVQRKMQRADNRLKRALKKLQKKRTGKRKVSKKQKRAEKKVIRRLERRLRRAIKKEERTLATAAPKKKNSKRRRRRINPRN